MFKREITLKRNGKEYRYLHLVHDVRKGKKVRQKLILSLGRVDKLNPQWVDRIVSELGDYTDKVLVLGSVEEISQRKAKSWGEILALSRLWEDVGLSQIVRQRQFLERVLEERLRQAGIKLSPSKALRKAAGLQASRVQVKDRPYLFRNEPNLVTKRLFKALQLKLPARIKDL